MGQRQRAPQPKRVGRIATKIGLLLALIAALCIFSVVWVQLYLAGALTPSLCPSTLPPLSMAHTSRLLVPSPCYIDLRNQCPGVIDLLAPYTASGDATNPERVLLSQDGMFYTTQPGSIWSRPIHKLSLPDSCEGVVALTRDGMRMACVAHTDGCVDCFTACTYCFGSSVDVVSLRPATFGRAEEIIPSEPDVAFGVLSWSPDGEHLVVVRQHSVNGAAATSVCSLAFYSSDLVGSAMVQRGDVSLSGVNVCGASQVQWSPDGSKIALLERWNITHPPALLVLATSALDAAIFSPGASKVVVQTVAPGHLVTLPSPDSDPYHANPYFAWTPGNQIAINAAYGHELVLVDPVSGQQSPVLSLPSDASPIQIFSWMPDGKRVVFAIGHYGTTFCGSPPDSVYMYSPPASPEAIHSVAMPLAV